MSELVLTGLDGKNPIALLAALGVLNAVADRAALNAPAPRLAWRLVGTYRPVLVDGPNKDQFLALLAEDLRTFHNEPALLGLRYRREADGPVEHDLKPSPPVFAAYLRGLVDSGSRRSLDLAAALATDVATDNNGNTKPTALHFTAGQQEFLGMVSQLIDGVTAQDLDEALFGPWRYARQLPVLQWDNSTSRDYALRASDPSKDKKTGVPGADWLAFRGLSFLRVAPVGNRIETTGCRGGWKTGKFRWPLWSAALTRSVITSVLASAEIIEADPLVMRARGVPVVFESSIRRHENGGYGSFSPARVAQPSDE